MDDDDRQSRDPEKVRIGAHLRAAREAAGLTREDVEERSNRQVLVNALANWERGKHDVGAVAALLLARLYGVTVQSLLDPSTPPKLRTSPIYFVNPVKLRALEEATTVAELKEVLRVHVSIGVQIDPGDQQVTRDEYHAAQERADRLYDEKVAKLRRGPLVTLWRKLRGLS